MARLETQINQIYLVDPMTKKASLVLYEEALGTSHHLFLLAELKDLQKKSEANDLKKISEIILASFRANKKLPAETLFETALAQINQNLADLAHDGHKSWVGKFSCLMALRSGDNIYLASNGQTSAWLKRNSEMLEILKPEKRGTHPLKTFQNFTQGKIASSDNLIIITSNVLDYISFELFSKILAGQTLDTASREISAILQQSLNDQAFGAFFLEFAKQSAIPPHPSPLNPIYAPLPEDLEPKKPIVTRVRIPKLNLRLHTLNIKWQFFKNLSGSQKFFFISFTIFLLLFAINLSAYGFRLHSRKAAQRVDDQYALVGKDLEAIQSALIYKDDKQAFTLLQQTLTDFETLKKLNSVKAQDYSAKLDQITNQVNRISIVNEPKVATEFKHHPTILAKSASGFLISGADSNSVSLFNGANTKDYFMLNSLKTDITGVSFWQPVGAAIATTDKLFFIDTNLKQFEPLVSLPGANVTRIKTYAGNLYALNDKGQLLKIISVKGKYISNQTLAGNFSEVRDFAVEKDVYLLYPDKLTKGSVAIPYPAMTDQITNATRIFLGGNLYILEPNKKRVVIITKTGALVNQIYFPTATNLLDLYVDEGQRSMFLLDDNKLLRITF